MIGGGIFVGVVGFLVLLLAIILGFAIIIGLLVAFIYNRLVVHRNKVDNAWSQIDVQLKKRFDLVPNLVETVKAYAKHERETFTLVTEARAKMASAKGVDEVAQANNMLTQALKSLFAVAEAYPELKANQNFMMLQEELAGIESKIAYARQFYNDSVLEYNNNIQTFPSNIIAGIFGFKPRRYFEIEEIEKKPVKVSF